MVPARPSSGGHAGEAARYEVLQQTEYAYDSAGRLAAILDNGGLAVSYSYDAAGRLAGKAFANGMKVTVTHDPLGRLARMEFSGGPLAEPKLLEYTWDDASQVSQRAWNDETQRYEYDPGGQLLKVVDAASGKSLESYKYDAAGNMLEKVIDGAQVEMTYNAANQLATFTGRDGSPSRPTSSDADASSTRTYQYDSAGRMLGYEGGPQSRYGWLDKVTDLALQDGANVTYTYWPDGQLASTQIESDAKDVDEGVQQIANRDPKIENETAERFLWDGLALLRRNDAVYLIEPHPSGGVPIASHPVGSRGPVTYFLNDMLGTTLATVQGEEIEFVKLTSFGQPLKTVQTGQSPQPLSAPSTPQAVPDAGQTLQTVQ